MEYIDIEIIQNRKIGNTMSDQKKCCYCGVGYNKKKSNLRPYGPGGKYLCFNCLKSDSKIENEAEKQFVKMLESAAKESNIVILVNDGPKPIRSKDDDNLKDVGKLLEIENISKC